MKTSTEMLFTSSSFCNQLNGEPTIGSKVADPETFLPILAEALASHDPDNDKVKGQSCVELPIMDDGQGSFTETAIAIRKSVMSGVGKRTRMVGVPPTVSPFPLTPEDEEVMRTGSWRKEIVRGPECYVSRLYRGVVGCYLKREFALPVEAVRVIVYTTDAYREDPDVSTEEYERVTFDAFDRVTHVIVAVLADAGPKSPLSPHRFAANFAGNKVMLERRHAIQAGISGLMRTGSEEKTSGIISAAHADDALRHIFEEAAEVTAYDEKYCVVADPVSDDLDFVDTPLE